MAAVAAVDAVGIDVVADAAEPTVEPTADAAT